jgi:uncharacterized cupredoxin-like copper-binding protein
MARRGGNRRDGTVPAVTRKESHVQQQRARTLPRLALAFFALAAAGVLAFVLLSGGSDGKQAKSAATTGPVKVRLTDYKIAPSASTVSAGKVTFAATNAGDEDHEMVVVRTDENASGLLKGDEASEAGAVDEIGEFKPGLTKRLTVSLKPGHYVLLCNVPGHYKAGMYKNFIVK